MEPLGSLGNAVIHTYLQPEVIKELTTVGMESIIDQIRFRVIDSLTEEYMSGDIDLPRLGEVIVKAASPEKAILETAEEYNADLLILGIHSPEVDGRHLVSNS
ncbi:hypothetical protein AB835_03480 [Candidatus Endobugula sertula]|uniref:UspA domain-containing protein n=1 Tax=Candidatus Endobugula sertula TaxID=62101 RepID=A0A1D2QSE7_9GAMM|nr:hypothetical protein AB835_03480 [Candidatus Endobugula sertula]